MGRFWAAMLVFAIVLGCNERRPTPAQASDAERVGSAKTADKADARPEKKTPQNLPGAFQPQVAGQFYTANPGDLLKQVKTYLDAAKPNPDIASRDIVAILAPHAGFRYSGPVAAFAYREVMNRGYHTVVILALSHRRAAAKAAVLDRPAYDTPLGSLAIDTHLARQLLKDYPDLFSSKEAVFIGEHSLEVQLPFIQVALPGVKIVPIILAVHDEGIVNRVGAALFETVGNRKDVLMVASSDLSHYFAYDEAVNYDQETLSLLEQWKIDAWKKIAPTKRGMCGYQPTLTLIGAFEKYEKSKRKVTLLSYKNSGDTSGDRSRGVVGYGALAFSVEKGMRMDQNEKKDFGPFTAADRRYLMDLAKAAVAAAAKGETFKPDAPRAKLLADRGAAFVTLKKSGQLRGCIGHVIARVPLFECVSNVARSAAIHDTRFSPVTPEELASLSYEVSVLTAPEVTTPEEVVVGRDGLIMSRDGRSGLLLPQVPVEWKWDRETFLAHTCRKAGLPLNCWKDPATKIESFRAIVWGEDDLHD